MVTDKVSAVVEVAVLDLHVSLEISIGGTDTLTYSTSRWMKRLDVLLHLGIGREADGDIEDGGVQTGVQVGHVGGTDFAPKAIAAVFTVLVTDEMCRGLESSSARKTSGLQDMVANKRLLIEMDELDMPVQGVLFSELLVAGGKLGTLEVLLGFVVGFDVLSEASAGVKGLFTMWFRTGIIADVLVLGLDMVLEVTVAEKGLVTAWVGAHEGAFIGVGAMVFGESHGTSVGLVTAWEVTQELLFAGGAAGSKTAGGRGLSGGAEDGVWGIARQGVVVVVV